MRRGKQKSYTGGRDIIPMSWSWCQRLRMQLNLPDVCCERLSLRGAGLCRRMWSRQPSTSVQGASRGRGLWRSVLGESDQSRAPAPLLLDLGNQVRYLERCIGLVIKWRRWECTQAGIPLLTSTVPCSRTRMQLSRTRLITCDVNSDRPPSNLPNNRGSTRGAGTVQRENRRGQPRDDSRGCRLQRVRLMKLAFRKRPVASWQVE